MAIKNDGYIALICLPYAGGSQHIFQPWRDTLEQFINIVTPELPGRGSRIFESPIDRLPELTEWLFEETRERLAGDYALWGHSMGGLLAFEFARSVRRRGFAQPVHLFVSGALPPDLPRHDIDYHRLDDAGLVEKLMEMGGTPEAVLRSRELMELFLPTIRADFAVCETYSWHDDEEGLSVPITVLGGDADMGVPSQALQGWTRFTSGRTDVQVLNGGHFFLRDHVEVLSGIILQRLRAALPSSAAA